MLFYLHCAEPNLREMRAMAILINLRAVIYLFMKRLADCSR